MNCPIGPLNFLPYFFHGESEFIQGKEREKMKNPFSNWWPRACALERFTIFMGVVGHFASYIQAIKIFSLQSAYAVSLLACLIGFASMLCWLAYGIERNIKPLIISNIFGLIGSALTILGVIYYGS
jgi:uncharacterized protein with PQ loop repeat